jgi:hypothetical protein
MNTISATGPAATACGWKPSALMLAAAVPVLESFIPD